MGTKSIIKPEYLQEYEEIRLKLKSLDSQKCRLIKMKDGFTESKYSEKMNSILNQIQILREMRNLITQKELTIPEMTEAQMDALNIDEVNHGLKSLQSRKYMNKYNPEGLVYRDTIYREKYLIERRRVLTEKSNESIPKSKMNSLIERVENLSLEDRNKVLMEELKKMVNN